MNRKNNRHLNYRKEKGAISLFVVLAMLFFIVFVVGSYTMISRKSQQQAESNAELKNAYVRDGQEQYDALVNNSSTEIPIKNKQDLYKIGTGAEIIDTSTGFSYIATPEATYSIKTTITIPMEEIAGFKGDTTDDYRFKDYIVYGDAKTEDTNNYKVTCEPGADIVYTLNGEFYKLLIYSASGNKTAPYTGYSYLENEFYIYKDTANFSAEPHEYLLYLSEDDGTFNELKADTNFFAHDAYGGIPNSTNINGIGNLKKSYFLFVKYEKSSAVIGKYLSDVVNVGDYVNYRLDYSTLLTNPDATDAKDGWRVVSKEYDKTKETYIIKLISEGAPIKYGVTGASNSDDITNFDKAVYDNFETTTFSGEKSGTSVKGSFFKNAYADNVQALNYQTLSMAITEDPSIDYINKKGGIGSTDIREYQGSTLIGYEYNKNEQKITKKGLLDIDKTYWIGKVSTNTNDVHYVNYTSSNSANKITKLGNGTTSTYGIRPVVTLIDNLIVIANDDGSAGTGTKENPYNIKIENKHTSGPSVGDYVVYTSNTELRYDYKNVKVKRNDNHEYTSGLTGWRILDVSDDGTVRLISAGIPLLYELKDTAKNVYKDAATIKRELIDNFTQTNFITDTGTSVHGDYLLNPEYASEISTLSYEDLSNSIYDNPDYITVSENEKWATTEAELFVKNTIADANFKRVINDWTNKKKNLFTVGSDYIITMNDGSRAFVYHDKNEVDNASLTTINDWDGSGRDRVGLRVVVTLKKTTKFLTGTGTKIDPYVLSGTVSADMAPFRVGDYVTYSEIPTYSNVSSLSNSSGKAITQTGWRVVSYKKEGSTDTLKLVSAGIPYYTTAFNMPGVSGKDYATHIKSFAYNTIEIKDAAGNRVDDKTVLTAKSDKIQTVEALDYDQYCNFVKLYNSREVSKDLLYLNQYYWLGSYYEHKEKDVVSYRLRYVSQTSDSSLLEQKTYGIRPVITLKSGFTVEVHSGTASDPHVLIFK